MVTPTAAEKVVKMLFSHTAAWSLKSSLFNNVFKISEVLVYFLSLNVFKGPEKKKIIRNVCKDIQSVFIIMKYCKHTKWPLVRFEHTGIHLSIGSINVYFLKFVDGKFPRKMNKN